MKTNYLSLACLFVFINGITLYGQNKYTFSQSSATYSDLTGDINVTHSFVPTTGLYTIPQLAGETFTFYGLPFTFGGLKTIAVGEAPFLRIDNDSAAIILDVAFTEVDSIDPTSKKSYKIEGVPGDKILKVQYKNLKLKYGPAGNFINVQMWCFQKTGVMELRYGPRSLNNSAGYNISTGPNIGLFFSDDDFFSKCYEKLWCNGNPPNLKLDSAANYVFKAMSGVPDEGKVYRFTPRTAATQTVSTVSIKEAGKISEFIVSPNPADEKITLSGQLQGQTAFIYDLTGKLVKQSYLASDHVEISVSDLTAGHYFVTMKDAQGETLRKEILISR